MTMKITFFLTILIYFSISELFASPKIYLTARDTEGDQGKSITLKWQYDKGQDTNELKFNIFRRDGTRKNFLKIASVTDAYSYTDKSVEDNYDYLYRVELTAPSDTIISNDFGPVQSAFNWFNTERINAFVLLMIFSAGVIYLILKARKGHDFFIRKIAGLDAIDEAIGRATEMGKKVLYIPGIMSLDEIQTIASLSILKYIAKYAAEYQTQFEVPNKDPITFAAARETVKEAFLIAGKPDDYNDDMVTYITYDQFAYTASVSGKMLREKPAANFLIGSFYAESLLLAETGNITGAIQIAGTAEVHQLPFFVCACDYTLIGEELYAASAYLSKEPTMVGPIKGQDLVKAVLIATIGAGIILETMGIHWITNFLKIM